MDRARSVVNVFILYFYFKTSAINNAPKAPGSTRVAPLSRVAPAPAPGRDRAPFRPLPGNCVFDTFVLEQVMRRRCISQHNARPPGRPLLGGHEDRQRRGTALGRKFTSRNKTFSFVLNSIFPRNTRMLTEEIIYFAYNNFNTFLILWIC